jgi:hypothetical protein
MTRGKSRDLGIRGMTRIDAAQMLRRGLAKAAVVGKYSSHSFRVTGLTMLGVGLHSYGFMDQAFGVLLAFIVSQLVIIGLGLVPQRYWRGIRARTVNVSAGAATRPDPVLVS